MCESIRLNGLTPPQVADGGDTPPPVISYSPQCANYLQSGKFLLFENLISKNYFSPFSARFFWLAMDTCGKRHNHRWSQKCLFVFHRGSTNLDGFAAEPHLSGHTAKCVLLLCLASKPRTKFLPQKFSSPNLKSFYLQISKVESVEVNSFVTWQTHSLCWIQTHPKQPEKDIMEIQ